MLLGVAKLAVAVTVAGPTFSTTIDDADVADWSQAGGVAHLIRAAWTEGEAAERQVTVSDEDVREAMDPPHDGLTRTQRLYEARIDLLDAALKAPISQAAAQSVTQAQIDAYVAAHPMCRIRSSTVTANSIASPPASRRPRPAPMKR